MMDRGKLFQELFECYKKLMADRSARESQEAATCMWNSIKAESKATPGLFERRIKDKIVEIETKARKQKATLMSFWCNVPVKKSTHEQAGGSSSTTEGHISPGEQIVFKFATLALYSAYVSCRLLVFALYFSYCYTLR
jgi:hypothetical protein